MTGYGAFTYAASYGHVETLKLHLAAPGLNVNLVDTNGATALIRAIRDYRTECVRLLLAHPDIDVNIQETSWPWGTALINAAMKTRMPTVGGKPLPEGKTQQAAAPMHDCGLLCALPLLTCAKYPTIQVTLVVPQRTRTCWRCLLRRQASTSMLAATKPRRPACNCTLHSEWPIRRGTPRLRAS